MALVRGQFRGHHAITLTSNANTLQVKAMTANIEKPTEKPATFTLQS